ncbi:MAG: helix-turn-helix domain-containing protein [Acetivibrionales bacterium]|jgi:transcriptional regulator with XRE-family HTH domain|nr:cupin domain-containing protein [Clostridiaceae bacterium]
MQIGNKIKRLRLESGMTQEEIADRCELTKGYISQLERDLTSPSISTLEDILECLGSSLQKFFGEEAIDEQVVFTDSNYFVKEAADHSYAINWIVPNAKKRLMEPIIVEISPNCSFEEDQPHQGEEFGMVLSGSLYLYLGKERFRLKKGDCFMFKPNKPHVMRNTGKTLAKILWISTPPSF